MMYRLRLDWIVQLFSACMLLHFVLLSAWVSLFSANLKLGLGLKGTDLKPVIFYSPVSSINATTFLLLCLNAMELLYSMKYVDLKWSYMFRYQLQRFCRWFQNGYEWIFPIWKQNIKKLKVLLDFRYTCIRYYGGNNELLTEHYEI